MAKLDIETGLVNVVEGYLEDYSFEDLLEEFDLTPSEVFVHLWEAGLIDELLLENFLTGE